jgi:hypothetical protein
MVFSSLSTISGLLLILMIITSIFVLAAIWFWIWQFITLIRAKIKPEVKALWVIFFIVLPFISAFFWWIFGSKRRRR